MRRLIIVPAVLIGCMVIIWVGTVAAVSMPMQLAVGSNSQPNDTTQADILAKINPAQHQSPTNVETDTLSCTLPESYPSKILRWCQMIEDSAQDTGLPARLIAAVMLQESGGDPLAYSSSGAVGLMQVMPRDGIASEFMCVNGPCFTTRPTITELQDPGFNIAYGSQMLADLYTRHGTYREALFRYGPMNMGYYYADLVLNIWDSYQ